MIILRLLLICLIPFSTACGTQSGVLPPAQDEGKAAVERFLAAELAGDYMSEATRIYGCEEDYQPSTDTVEPVGAANVLGVSTFEDTVRVHVEYWILGYSYLGDHSQFMAEARVDTVMFQVVKDTTNQVRIFCGPHTANHWGVAAMEPFLGTFDDRSHQQWLDAIEGFRKQ